MKTAPILISVSISGKNGYHWNVDRRRRMVNKTFMG